MDSLAPELFDDIFKYVTDLQDLLSLRSVNKFFHATFTPLVYQTIALHNTRPSVKKLAEISSSGLTQWVKHLLFDMTFVSTVDDTFPRCPPLQLSGFTGVDWIFLRLPLVTSNSNFRCRLRNTVLKTIMNIPSTPSYLAITNLTTNGNRDSVEHRRFQAFLSHLDHLSLQVSAYSEDIGAHYLGAWLKPCQDRLTSLTICSRNFAVYFPEQLQFRNLRKLELIFFVFSWTKPSQAESFILSESVAATLEQLTLGSCTLSMKKRAGQRTWAHVFSRFQNTLTKLKLFTLQSPLSYSTYLGIRVSFLFSRPAVDVYLADVAALNALWECIGQQTRVSPEDHGVIHMSYLVYRPEGGESSPPVPNVSLVVRQLSRAEQIAQDWDLADHLIRLTTGGIDTRGVTEYDRLTPLEFALNSTEGMVEDEYWRE